MNEIAVYRGNRYRRYPESKRRHHRVYFYATEPRRGFLHRHIWEDENGPIPLGHEIHHVDEDTLNNAPGNLECVKVGWHRAHHLRKRASTPENLARLDAIRPLAKAWHQTDEGRALHSANGRKVWEGRSPEETRCVCCGAVVRTYFASRAKFCDNTCGARYRRRGADRGF